MFKYLTKLARSAESVASTISFEEEIHKYDLRKEPAVAKWWREDKYYTMLGALCKALKSKKVAEVGTMYGGSAVGLSKGCKDVTCYDIDMSNLVNKQMMLDKGIKLVELAHPDDCLAIPFTDYDFLFIDIGDHDGKYEREIHEILTKEYTGVVAYDDVDWRTMKEFWASVEQPKLHTTWHESGFGLVYYEAKIIDKLSS